MGKENSEIGVNIPSDVASSSYPAVKGCLTVSWRGSLIVLCLSQLTREGLVVDKVGETHFEYVLEVCDIISLFEELVKSGIY